MRATLYNTHVIFLWHHSSGICATEKSIIKRQQQQKTNTKNLLLKDYKNKKQTQE